MPTTIRLRRGTSTQWTSQNTVLGNGEPGFETDTGRIKLGDGVKTWTQLPYFLSESEVSSIEKSRLVDDLALTRVEREAMASIRAFGSRVASKFADANIITENWANLDRWPDRLAATVNGNRFVGSASSYAVNAPINLKPGEHLLVRAEILITASGKSIYLGFNSDPAGSVVSGAPNGVYMGVNTTNALVFFKGTNVSSGWENAGTALAQGRYLFTMVIDDSHISASVLPAAGGNPLYTTIIARNVLPNNSDGTIPNIAITGTGSTDASTTSLGPISIVKGVIAPPQLASQRTVAGITLYGASRPITFMRRLSGIRHIYHLPSLYDPRIPAPYVQYLHGATESGASPFGTTKGLAVINALEGLGYIFGTSDNGPSSVGGHGTGDDKYGNQAGVDDYALCIKTARFYFNTSQTFLWGLSQGTVFAQQILKDRQVGGIAAVAMSNPALDLSKVDDNSTFTPYIRSAWGASDRADFLVKIAGKNPIAYDGSQLRGVPQYFIDASDDTISPPADFSQPFYNKLMDYAPVQRVVVTGGHAGTNSFRTDIANFFEQSRYDIGA